MTKRKRRIAPCLLVALVSMASPLSVQPFTVMSHQATSQQRCRIKSQLLYADNCNNVPSALQRQQERSIESNQVARIRHGHSLEAIMAALKESFASPNVLAAALRRLTQLPALREENEAMISNLTRKLNEALHQKDDDNYVTVYAMVDGLCSLAFLKNKRRKSLRAAVKVKQLESQELHEQQLSHNLLQRMDRERVQLVRSLQPSRLVDTLYAINILGYGNSSHKDGMDSDSGSPAAARIQMEIMQKLLKGHALAQLSAGDLSIALTTLADTNQPLNSLETSLAVALMRRFRKQSIRRSATFKQLARALQSASDIAIQAKALSQTSDEKMFQEAQLMAFTDFKEILQSHKPANATTTMTLSQVADVVFSVSVLGVLDTQQASPNNSTLQILWEEFLDPSILSDASVASIAVFLRTVESIPATNLELPSSFVIRLGQRFLEEVKGIFNHNNISVKMVVEPGAANAILRYVALRWSRNPTVMKPFVVAGQMLLTNDRFLDRCGPRELTNFLSFLEKTRHYDVQDNNLDPLISVSRRVLDEDVVEAATPAQASRMLSTFTTIAHERQPHEKVFNANMTLGAAKRRHLNGIHAELFFQLGGHLLTDDLSPRDLSSALTAYASASYVQDMGIFDHLAASLASRVDECSIRQICQGLWACGKMAVWEQQEMGKHKNEKEEDQSLHHQPLPYQPSAEQFAKYLVEHKSEMTTKDVAQTIWALGRLHSSPSRKESKGLSIDPFVAQATNLAPDLTSQEVANILWGMSRTNWKDCGDDTVKSFTDRIMSIHKTQQSCTARPNPQEAANILLALGRMNIQNEKLFEVLAIDMLDQLDRASAQAIANALWGFRAVHIAPPQQLLDRWAIERLGLAAVQNSRKQR